MTSALALRWRRALGPLVVLVVPVALGSIPAFAQTLVDPTLSVEIIASGLSQPTSLAFLGPDDILVLEKSAGTVRRVRGGVLEPDPVLTLSVDSNIERGLLGIAINQKTPRSVFLYYTEAAEAGGAPTNRVVRYRWSAAAGRLRSPVPLLELPSGSGAHVGGALALGLPSQGELLYVAIGDLDVSRGLLQNRDNGRPPDDRGVILRLTQEGAAAPGNPLAPFCESPAREVCSSDADCTTGPCYDTVRRYFAYGIRNSFGLAIDPATGDLWDTENGTDAYDELNRITPGMNSGWDALMGPAARNPGALDRLVQLPGAGDGYRDPEFAWVPRTAPTGLAFLLGSSLGRHWDDSVLVSAWHPVAESLYALPLAADRRGLDLSGLPGLEDGVADSAEQTDPILFGSGFGSVTDLELGPHGHLYALSFSRGRIYRIAGPDPVPGLPLAGLVTLVAAIGAVGAIGARRASSARRSSVTASSDPCTR